MGGEVHLQPNSPPPHPFPVLGSGWTLSSGQYWGPSELSVGHGAAEGAANSKLPFSCATSFHTQQITFLIWTWLNIPYPVRIRKAGWLFAPRRMNASLYCICIISYQLQQVRESTTALLTSGLADSWKLNSTSATGDRKYRESILFTSRFVLNYPSLPPASHRCEEMRNRTGQHLSKQSWLVFLDTKINKLDWLNIPPPRECTLFAGKDKGS